MASYSYVKRDADGNALERGHVDSDRTIGRGETLPFDDGAWTVEDVWETDEEDVSALLVLRTAD